MADHSIYDMVFSVERPKPLDHDLPKCASTRRSLLADGRPDLQDWCSVFDKSEMEIVSTLLTHIFEGQQSINSLLHTPLGSDERSQRTPVLGFVGDVSRSLFGTATVGDVQRVTAILNNVVDRVNEQDDATSAELRLLHVAVNRTGVALDTLKDATTLNSRQIISITNSLRESYKSINKSQFAIQALTRAINRLTDYVTKVADRRTNIYARLLSQAIFINSFVEALIDLPNGIVSPQLVPPRVLRNSLEAISKAISKSYPGYQLVHTDPNFYYTSRLATTVYTDNHLLVHVKVPFSRESSLYSLYQTTAFPIPIQTNDPSSVGYTVADPISPYIAISPDKNSYFELSNSEFSLCTGEQLLICQYDHVLVHRPQYSCTAAIFFHQDEIFTQVCSPKLFPNSDIPDNILPIGQGKYLVTSTTNNYRMTCTDQTIHSLPSLAYAQVSVPCGCTLTVNHLTVAPPVSSCNEKLQVLQTFNQ